jgi:hypothetical protein
MAEQFLAFSLSARRHAPRSGSHFCLLLLAWTKVWRLAGRDPPVLISLTLGKIARFQIRNSGLFIRMFWMDTSQFFSTGGRE